MHSKKHLFRLILTGSLCGLIAFGTLSQALPSSAARVSDLITPTAVQAEKKDDIAIDLTVPQTLEINRPAEELTTGYSSYFITGTSDPAQPLYLDEEELERQGTMGVFGAFVELEEGENTFVFTQGEEIRTVVINRPASSEEAVSATIDTITQSSMFPAVQGGVKVEGSIPLRCIAPAGGTVTASFDGQTVELEQAAVADEGIPATFTGKLTVKDNYDRKITQRVGPITYTLDFDGETKSYTSSGDMYVAGLDTDVVLRVSSYIGFVYPDLSDLSNFKAVWKQGACDYLTTQTNNYFGLYSGGYIPADMVEIVTGEGHIDNKLIAVHSRTKDNGEYYVFSGNASPAYSANLNESNFSFTLYNTQETPEVTPVTDNLFSEIIGKPSADKNEELVTYTFTLKENTTLWGYNVLYDDKGNLYLEFQYKPQLVESADKPLEGLNIVVDPGHGGTDAGTLGIMDSRGPNEKDVNLAHAYAIRDKLEAMGATVWLTRVDDSYYSLDNRLRDQAVAKADFFVSIHHNSTGNNVDANEVSGMEIYYHTPYSQAFAETMMDSLISGLGRKSRFVNQSYYRVNLLPYTPSILVELGFMNNPLEFERSVTESEIDRVADAVADGIVAALK